MKIYQEDSTIQGRRNEIGLKLKLIREMLEAHDMEALLLQKHPNFSWLTAGGKNFVANCFDDGATALLVTLNGCYAICNVIESPRLLEEEHLDLLGFEVIDYPWQEKQLESIVGRYVSSTEKIVSDEPMGKALVRPEWIRPLRIHLTENEIGRYLYLGEKLSEAIEACLAVVKRGMTEYEITGLLSEYIWPYGIEQVMHLVSADERACRYRHALPTEKKLENNLIVSINGRYKGLIVTTSRMVYLGQPDEAFVRQYRDCCEMECLTDSMAKIGADEIVMYDTLKQAYIDKGYPTMFDKHGQGGCQGYWPREYMITPDSHHPVGINQAYCFNPVVDGTKTEDSFIVTQEGIVLITRPISYPKLTFDFNGTHFERPDLLVLD